MEGRFKHTGGTVVKDISKRSQYEATISSEQSQKAIERMREDLKDYEINKLKTKNENLQSNYDALLARVVALEGAGS